jgi:ABC-type transport system involved in multi-copper enzyme maturation permease subunit
MLRTILKREILHNLYSLRFQVSLALVLCVFVVGSFSFVRNHDAGLKRYQEVQAQYLEELRAEAKASATELAVNKKTFSVRPRDNAFIYDGKEKYLPNAIVFSAWNVFSFLNKSGSTNPFLNAFEELNWSFIVALILSFVALLLTFDAVSGEKEARTLALALSNSVSRGALLFGKYISAILTFLAMVLPGIMLSVLVVLFSGRVSLGPAFILETVGFLVVATLMAAVLAAFGLLCSVAARNSNISLLLALAFWILFAVVIPNSSTFIAKTFFPIERTEAIQKKVMAAFDDLNKSAPPGSWMSNSGNPFLPQHELRANLQRKRLEAEKGIRDAYYQSLFRQFEKTRLLTAASPVPLFQYLTEAVVGGGYPRFRKAWDDFHVYQGQFLAFFKNFDAQDPKSPHWYNPHENVSTTRKPVAFETVPQFVEKPMTFAERVKPTLVFLVINIAYACLIFFLSFVLFVRYDVR